MKSDIQSEWRKRARAIIPGGVNSPVRSFKSVGAEPLVVERAEGAQIWDADGNAYDDYVLSWGPMIFGHGEPRVTAAVQAALLRGTSYGMTHPNEVRFAELFLQLVPEMQMLRLVSSGTEATMSALRLARGVTGRDLIVKFIGCYHGHGDSLLVRAGSGVATLGIPGSPGIPSAIAELTLALPFNDVGAMDAALAQHGDRIAGIIVETLPGNMGLVKPSPEFIASLARAQDHGALLIADEVMTGFRVPQGAAFRHFGLKPDITTWGKVVGAGLPLAVYAASRAIMEHMAPVGPVYQAGTLSGNPLAVAAGIAVLERLSQEKPWDTLGALAQGYVEQMQAVAVERSVPFVADSCGSMLGMFFGAQRPQNFEQVAATDQARFGAWFRFALEDGILLAPSGYEAGFLSTCHTQQHCTRMTESFARFCRTL